MHSAVLRLKKDQERRLSAGHSWVYSNEVDTDVTPLKALEPGQTVEILGQSGRWLGWGYVNPHSLICARLVSRNRDHPLSTALWVQRIRNALGLRKLLYAHPFYRLVFGESDGLPGLIVDRYGDLLCVQITTAGMERAQAEVLTALEQVLRPRTIVLRNDIPSRDLEGLAQGVQTVLGEAPEAVELEESGARFLVSRVLDVFSYIGAWGVQAAVAGAEEVVCVDSSPTALERAGENAERNGVVPRVSGLQGDAFDVLRALREEGARFDLVILDPPAFDKRRKNEAAGVQAYLRLNRLGLEVLEPGGVLVTSSCSFHMGRDRFLRTVQQAGRRAERSLQLLEAGGQGPDHPVHPAIPATAYLKTFFFRVLPAF
ncbi:MAG: class I SAM-dependent rRNA methyltransferase [Chromatiaceae bacterium]